MFFEGSEKKAEIIIDSRTISLLEEYSDDFWSEMVSCCGAKILSSIQNEQLKAFLLSESSLFIWQDRLIILTCGDTQLVDSIIHFLKHIPPSAIKQVIYQRKNEYCSHIQPSHILEDSKKLNNMIPGNLLRFGELDSHHTYLFHLNNGFNGGQNNKSYEVLIYNIGHEISRKLTDQSITVNKIRDLLELDNLLSEFQIDDFVFSPFGYSLNAIRGRDYFTIHLTPQAHNSYVSFESNINLIDFIPTLLAIFQPGSFDVLTFNEPAFSKKMKKVVSEQFNPKESVQHHLDCSLLVNYATYNRQQTELTKPTLIDLKSEHDIF